MNFTQIQTILNDLPSTFKRAGTNPFLQYIDSITAALTRGGLGSDGMAAEGLNFKVAQYGWLDTWGAIFNVVRQQSQADENYLTQINYTVNVQGGTPVQIIRWFLIVYGIIVSIQENIPNLGYVLTFPPTVGSAQLIQLLTSLAYVRPAGVPFTVNLEAVGTYLETINFLNAPRVTGAYMSSNAIGSVLGIPSSTNNAPSLLPDLFLVDPTLNPSFAAVSGATSTI